MIKKKCLLAFIFSLILFSENMTAQTVKISGELRPRFEFRNGYKSLMPDGFNPAAFISQRTRLNAFYADNDFKFYISLQNIRTWGDVKQLNTMDMNGTSIHEAWGQVNFSKKIALKMGRQEIIYDDQRIFGNVGWAQQARSHDAFIFKIIPNDKHHLDLGFAYNAIKESLYKLDYLGMANYKAFQFIHYSGNFKKFNLSILELYNGMAYDADTRAATTNEKIAWSTTIGPRISYKGDKVKSHLSYYYQGGKNRVNDDLSASYLGADVSFALVNNFSFGLGFEYLSGTATKEKGTGKDRSFTPLYGTNHKFNGWMDYFYVGNHAGNVGLNDIYIPLKFNYEKWFFVLNPHKYISAASISQKQADGTWKDFSNSLGTEIDFSFGYNLNNAVNMQVGYSQMFATESMQVLKGGNYNNSNNWAWVMFTFKPVFLDK